MANTNVSFDAAEANAIAILSKAEMQIAMTRAIADAKASQCRADAAKALADIARAHADAEDREDHFVANEVAWQRADAKAKASQARADADLERANAATELMKATNADTNDLYSSHRELDSIVSAYVKNVDAMLASLDF